MREKDQGHGNGNDCGEEVGCEQHHDGPLVIRESSFSWTGLLGAVKAGGVEYVH